MQELVDYNTGKAPVINHPTLTKQHIELFCEHNDVAFHAMGCPPGAGGSGWDDPAVVRLKTNTVPAGGVTVTLDSIAQWLEVFKTMGEPKIGESITGWIYVHYKGSVYETLLQATEESTGRAMVAYRSLDDGRVWVRPYDEFFQVIQHEGQWVCRFTRES